MQGHGFKAHLLAVWTGNSCFSLDFHQFSPRALSEVILGSMS